MEEPDRVHTVFEQKTTDRIVSGGKAIVVTGSDSVQVRFDQWELENAGLSSLNPLAGTVPFAFESLPSQFKYAA